MSVLLAACGSTVGPPDADSSVPPPSVTPGATLSIGGVPGTLPTPSASATASATPTSKASSSPSATSRIAGSASTKFVTATASVGSPPWSEGFAEVVTITLANGGAQAYRGPVGVATTLTSSGFAQSATPNGTVRQLTTSGRGPVLPNGRAEDGPYVAHTFAGWDIWAVSAVKANVPARSARTYRFEVNGFRSKVAVSGVYGPRQAPTFAGPVDVGQVLAPRIALAAVQTCTHSSGSPRVTTCTATVTLTGVPGRTYSGLRWSFRGRASNSAGPGTVKITVKGGSSTWKTTTSNSQTQTQHVYPTKFTLGPKSVRTFTVKYSGVFQPDDVGTDDLGNPLIGIDMALAGPRSTDSLHVTPA